MHRIGIDVGSSYTKYCILGEKGEGFQLFLEKTPLMQRSYFARKLEKMRELYGDLSVISCGYGKKNVVGMRNVNELTALAQGCFHVFPESEIVLDIGGQDTKVIRQERGKLKEFFVNDRCAAGSGMFLSNTCRLLGIPFEEIDLSGAEKPEVRLSAVCAVFAQSEIVNLLAEDTPPVEILRAVIWQILTQASALLKKVGVFPVLLSGGLTQIRGFREYAQLVLGRECHVGERGNFLSAVGCALLAEK